MTPSHAVKQGTRYRYYVSGPLITKDQSENSLGLRVPAAEIEQLVTRRVRQWLLDPGLMHRFQEAHWQRVLRSALIPVTTGLIIASGIVMAQAAGSLGQPSR